MRASFAALLAVVLGLSACSSSTKPPTTSPPRTPASLSATAVAGLPRALASAPGWLAFQSGSGTDHVHLVHVDGDGDHIIGESLPGEQRHPDFSRAGAGTAGAFCSCLAWCCASSTRT